MAHVERIMYVELKKDFNDDGPAWIGRVRFSKTARTAYYRGRNLCRHNGMAGNYIDVATLEEYWISGVKKDRTDRHWAGRGRVDIDPDVRDEYLRLIDPKLAAKLRKGAP
ncbi:MAG: SICA family protein [Candidatus Dormibacteraeota bacterium]|nr:SICA family protein [Candidatus Dormibacteraeota bacterium]